MYMYIWQHVYVATARLAGSRWLRLLLSEHSVDRHLLLRGR